MTEERSSGQPGDHPHHSTGSQRGGPSRGVSRRDFVAAAVAIGGASALSACMDRERSLLAEGSGSSEFPSGTDPAALPAGQHVWNEFLVHDAHGNTTLPQHQLVLGLRYVGSVPPTEAERAQVEGVLSSLERAVAWGTGGDPAATINDGLLAMLGYSQRYFERLGSPVDELLSAEAVLEQVGEDPSLADGFDAVLVLNSDFGSLLLEAETALVGDSESLNGTGMDASFEGVFEVVERRTGVVGKGLPAQELPDADIPEDAALSMGFRSGFRDNQASEDRVTIGSGPFAGGTTLLASRLHVDLGRWYEQSADDRIGAMFCPAHDPDEVGETGDRLGSGSGVTKSDADHIPEDAERYGRLGHSQKVATARDEQFRPRILRRTEGVATDVAEGAGFNFHSIQETLTDFVATRNAMHVAEHDLGDGADVPDDHHGIVDYLETQARGTFLVPPRDRRALPVPEP